MQHIFFFI